MDRPRSSCSFIFGLALLFLGIAYLLNLYNVVAMDLARVWLPILIMALGFWMMVGFFSRRPIFEWLPSEIAEEQRISARRWGSLVSGFLVLLFGVYLLLVNYSLIKAEIIWPALLILLGIALIWRFVKR